MQKIFYNALNNGGDDNGGWFVCEMRDYPYKHKTDKPLFTAIDNTIDVSKEPEVTAFFAEREAVYRQLHDEILKVAADLNITIPDNDIIVLEDDDGKKLSDALISLGWKKQFIAIGP